jgi:hypothetical protein
MSDTNTITTRPSGGTDGEVMKMQFRLTFKSGTKTVGEVTGLENRIEASNLTVEDLVENVIKTEQFLERLTGLRVHIEQVQ